MKKVQVRLRVKHFINDGLCEAGSVLEIPENLIKRDAKGNPINKGLEVLKDVSKKSGKEEQKLTV